jgi:hypothetical protein
MRNKLVITVCGLMMLGVSPSWAGTTGNGWTHPAHAVAPQQTQPQNPQT